MQAVEDCLDLEVSDVSRQKMARVSSIPPDANVGELVQALLDELKLPQSDALGRPLSYQALLQRESRHLQSAERVGSALKTGDSLTLQPSIDAGARRSA